MTDENQGQEPESGLSRPPGMPGEEHDDNAVLEGAGDFTSGEGLVAFAGIVLVLDWLIFGVIANDYWVGWLALVPGVAAAMLPRMKRENVERFHPLPLLMKLSGYLIALIGIFSVIEDIRFAGNVFDEVLGVIGALVAYAAFVMAFIGARQIDA